ncbi:unnamed protein product [Meloidogyne enterolobii]|uniref:Uncharacterized protein n=1 Tax=Meloidogyne enterolobii TaxID=390850 RepID=A0ACB1AK71_MELEN
MSLFFLFIFFNSLFNFVSPYSIFVKISWRDNGENGENYYKRLAKEEDERFKLELNGDQFGNPRLTDINDTFHFENLNAGPFTLKITIYGLIKVSVRKDGYWHYRRNTGK